MTNDRDQFLYPRSSYQGDVKPENLVFNANLQEFSQRLDYICGLETGGKLSSEAAYQQIKGLWEQLKQSHQQLGIGEIPSVLMAHERRYAHLRCSLLGRRNYSGA